MSVSKKVLVSCLLELLAVAEELCDAWIYKKKKRWINRTWIVRPINRRRLQYGFYTRMFKEIKCDAYIFFCYTRMDIPTFHYLLSLVQKHLMPLRKCSYVISAEQCLAITLRYFILILFAIVNKIIIYVLIIDILQLVMKYCRLPLTIELESQLHLK